MLWGWVLGPLGELLAVMPVTLLAKRLVIEAYDEWKWFSVVMGDVPREGPPKTRRKWLSKLRPHHRGADDGTSEGPPPSGAPPRNGLARRRGGAPGGVRRSAGDRGRPRVGRTAVNGPGTVR